MFKGLSKEEKSWAMFDWADSAYATTVLTVVMSMYFLHSAQQAGLDNAQAAANYGFANGFVTLIAGLMSPILGTLSGFKGKKKVLFNFFTFIGIVATLAIAIVPSDNWFMLLVVYIISAIAFNACNKVYDAFLADVSPKENMNRVSALGFGLGYIGGAIAFVISIVLLVLTLMGAVDVDINVSYRVAFLVTGIWWLIFAIPFFKNVKQVIGVEPEKNYVKQSFVNIGVTLKEIAKDKKILLFLIAFFLYSDGVGSIIRMAVIYGETIGINQMILLVILLVLQLIAFPFSILYGKLADKYGAKRIIYVCIITYCIVCGIALFMNPNLETSTLTNMFWILAILVGTAQGGIQALSRSYFGRIIPKEKSNEYYGIYNVFGRFASIIGTTLFGVISLATGYPHLGIAGIVIVFILAAIIFKFVPDDRTLVNN